MLVTFLGLASLAALLNCLLMYGGVPDMELPRCRESNAESVELWTEGENGGGGLGGFSLGLSGLSTDCCTCNSSVLLT